MSGVNSRRVQRMDSERAFGGAVSKEGAPPRLGPWLHQEVWGRAGDLGTVRCQGGSLGSVSGSPPSAM